MKILSLLCVLALSTALLAPVSRAQQPTPFARPTPPIPTGGEVAATAAAEVWLALVDDGQYEKSWDSAAKILQGIVTKNDWMELAKTRRPVLGKVISRKATETTATRNLPGAPEGQYVVIQYATEFEHKNPAKETVTVAVEASGAWKVSGYYIR